MPSMLFFVFLLGTFYFISTFIFYAQKLLYFFKKKSIWFFPFSFENTHFIVVATIYIAHYYAHLIIYNLFCARNTFFLSLKNKNYYCKIDGFFRIVLNRFGYLFIPTILKSIIFPEQDHSFVIII